MRGVALCFLVALAVLAAEAKLKQKLSHKRGEHKVVVVVGGGGGGGVFLQTCTALRHLV